MTQLHTLTSLARTHQTTAKGLLKKLDAAGIVPVHTRVGGPTNREYRLYGDDAYAAVIAWRQALDARAKAVAARKAASKQRKLVKELKASVKQAKQLAVLPPAPVETDTSKLAEKIDLLVTAVEVLTRRLDAHLGVLRQPAPQPVWQPPSQPMPWPQLWPVISGEGTAKANWDLTPTELTQAADAPPDEPVLGAR